MITLDIDYIRRRLETHFDGVPDLAEKAGMTERYLRHIINETAAGRAPGVSTTKISGLCRALKVTPKRLLIYS